VNSLRSWLRYLEHKEVHGEPSEVILLYERALLSLPWSYKLWMAYIQYRSALSQSMAQKASREGVLALFLRALCFLHRMPGMWEAYLNYLIKSQKFSLLRKAFNTALRALPKTQHERIWKLILPLNPPKALAIALHRRYLQVKPLKFLFFLPYIYLSLMQIP
jgi:pre-mRNA-splicing factor SYF1